MGLGGKRIDLIEHVDERKHEPGKFYRMPVIRPTRSPSAQPRALDGARAASLPQLRESGVAGTRGARDEDGGHSVAKELTERAGTRGVVLQRDSPFADMRMNKAVPDMPAMFALQLIQ